MRILFIVAAACALAGCIHTQAQDDATCKSYDAKPGTQLYTLCRMQLNAQRQERLTTATRAFQSLSESDRQRPVLPAPQVRMPSMTTCNASTFGNNTTMHCW